MVFGLRDLQFIFKCFNENEYFSNDFNFLAKSWFTCMLIGLSFLVFASPERSWFLVVGVPFFHGTNMAYAFIFNNFCTAYPKHQGILYGLSFSFMSLAQFLYIYYKEMPDTSYFWLVLIVILPFGWLKTILTFPKTFIESGEKLRLGWKTRNDSRKRPDGKNKKIFDMGLIKAIFRPINILTMIWFVLTDIRRESYLVEFQNWLRWASRDYEDPESVQSQYTVYYNICFATVLFTDPITGLLIDKVSEFQVKRFKFPQNKAQANTSLGCMLMVCVWYGVSCLLQTMGVGASAFFFMLFQITGEAFAFMGRFLFISAINGDEYKYRVLSVVSFVQIVTAFIQPGMTSLLQNYNKIVIKI